MPNISIPLLNIFNKSLNQGVFPNEMKIAKVIPIFKSGNKECINNYRPISLLPQFSKLLEKLFTSRLYNFLLKHKVIYPSQYGFQKQCSTSAAVIELTEEITGNMEKKLITACIFIDLKKAFDTVNHDILLKKLEHYGIRGLALDWVSSYLSNRRQYVSICGTNSEELLIKCGVPQGSVLGPILFLIYINDVCHTSEILKFILFADDTTIIYSQNNFDDLIRNVNAEMIQLCDWFSANKLSLNLDKTNYIIFNQPKIYKKTFSITMCGTTIERVNVCKFLGIYVDEKLNWKKQIEHTRNKLARTLGIMYRTSYLFDEYTRKIMYNTLFVPHLNYCSEIWGNTYKTNLQQVNIQQKKAIRIICNVSRIEHTTPLFKKLNILKFSDLVRFRTAILMQKIFLKQMPINIQKFFHIKTHKYPQRHINQFIRITHRTRLKSRTLSVIGVKLWNELDNVISSLTSNSLFKSKLKRNVIANYSR
jgi:hypothetical protein